MEGKKGNKTFEIGGERRFEGGEEYGGKIKIYYVRFPMMNMINMYD